MDKTANIHEMDEMEVLTPEDARRILTDGVKRALSKVADSETQVMSLAAPVEPLDAFRWIRGQRIWPRLYWAGRDAGSEVVAAVGEADSRDGAFPDRLSATAPEGLRYYGGMSFDPGRRPGENWEAFGALRFVLPRFELRADTGGSTLICNLLLPQDAGNEEDILRQIERLAFPPGMESGFPDRALPAPAHRTDVPGRRGWERNIGRALAAFAGGSLEKVVLARRVEFGFEEELDSLLLAESLAAVTPGCFHFYFEPEAGTSFVGASPERLFRREGSRILSEAVAGTRPRGASETSDEELRDELLHSKKDLSEHEYVRRSIRKTLESFCEEMEMEQCPSEMKLAQSRHLVSKIRGRLREGVTDADLLGALHPTPAVGGHPREEALELIHELEPFDRGWYAAPIGWVGTDGAEFAVGIRSGLVRERKLALFSGNGIVPGSDPAEEWVELEQKISGFAKVLGIGPEHAGR